MQPYERSLIVHSMHTHITPEKLQVIHELMEQQLDWQYIVKLLEHNHVISLFAYNLSRFSPIPG